MTGIIKRHSILSLVLSLVLIAAMAFTLVSCDKNPGSTDTGTQNNGAVQSVDSVVGEGDISFTFEAVFADGTSKVYTVNTSKETLDEALLEHELIGGTESQFGLTVMTVCGVTYDFEAGDKMYWSFYVNGDYAPTGVSATKVETDTTYTFKAEKVTW